MNFDLKDIRAQPQRIAVVTGANSGLGLETAFALAQKQIRVILACRDLAKAEKAKIESSMNARKLRLKY